MPDFLTGAYIGVGATLLGTLFTYLLSRRLIQQTHENDLILLQINESNKAAADIRGAFAPALAVLYLAKKHRNYSGDTVPPFDVDRSLKEALLTQASAIEVFRPHVAESQRTAYQEAWEKYRYEVFNYGFDTTTFRSDVDDYWKVYEDLIHGILRFAEIKDK